MNWGALAAEVEAMTDDERKIALMYLIGYNEASVDSALGYIRDLRRKIIAGHVIELVCEK